MPTSIMYYILTYAKYHIDDNIILIMVVVFGPLEI